MRIEDVMTREPACCTLETSLQTVAQMMVGHDCGQIPVVRSKKDPNVVGVVTDRDIVARLVAQGRNPLDLRADSCLSQPAITVGTTASVEECIRVMETHRIRRVPVVDTDGRLRGIVSQADIAQHASHASTGALVTEVSRGGETRGPEPVDARRRRPVPSPKTASPQVSKKRPRNLGASAAKGQAAKMRTAKTMTKTNRLRGRG